MKVDDEKIRLEKEAEQLLAVSQDDAEAQIRLEDVYERCDSLVRHLKAACFCIMLSMSITRHSMYSLL